MRTLLELPLLALFLGALVLPAQATWSIVVTDTATGEVVVLLDKVRVGPTRTHRGTAAT